MQQTFCGYSKAILGVALIALGLFVFRADLEQSAAQMNYTRSIFLPAGNADTLGTLPTIILVLWRVWRCYAADQLLFLHGVFYYLSVFCWPVLLFVVGTLLMSEEYAEE